MVQLSDLGLTPAQLGEVHSLEPDLLAAWLQAASDPGVRSPAGVFLAGIRSGEWPHAGVGHEGDRLRLVTQAERWINSVGCLLDRPTALLDELFDDRNALLHPWRNDGALRDRMLGMWEVARPDGERVEQEFADRARRYREGRREP